jgi:hypothetical protein
MDALDGETVTVTDMEGALDAVPLPQPLSAKMAKHASRNGTTSE